MYGRYDPEDLVPDYSELVVHEGKWGNWKSWSTQHDDRFVCGVKARYSSPKLDTTALNGLRFELCEVPFPIYEFQGAWTQIYDNESTIGHLDEQWLGWHAFERTIDHDVDAHFKY